MDLESFLHNFCKTPEKKDSEELNQILERIAKSGDLNSFNWREVRELLKFKIYLIALNDHANWISRESSNVVNNVNAFNLDVDLMTDVPSDQESKESNEKFQSIQTQETKDIVPFEVSTTDKYHPVLERIYKYLSLLPTEPPFTLQRACELILRPSIYSAERAMLMIEKCFKGITITTECYKQEVDDRPPISSSLEYEILGQSNAD